MNEGEKRKKEQRKNECKKKTPQGIFMKQKKKRYKPILNKAIVGWGVRGM